MSVYAKYKVDVPEGSSGIWCVEKFVVSEEDSALSRIRSMMHGRGYVPPGPYTRLRCALDVIMSDTPDEISDHFPVIRRAQGYGLINGLGLGLVLNAVLMKPEVRHVTVVEKSPDVIALVGPHWRARHGDRFTVIEGDALTVSVPPPPGGRWDFAWHDIWPSICAGHVPEMTTLHRRYGRRALWQGSWCRDRMRRAARINRR